MTRRATKNKLRLPSQPVYPPTEEPRWRCKSFPPIFSERFGNRLRPPKLLSVLRPLVDLLIPAGCGTRPVHRLRCPTFRREDAGALLQRRTRIITLSQLEIPPNKGNWKLSPCGSRRGGSRNLTKMEGRAGVMFCIKPSAIMRRMSRAAEIDNCRVFSPAQLMFPDISYSSFVYPGDEEALAALKKVPGASTLLIYLQKNFTEGVTFVENNQQMIRANTKCFCFTAQAGRTLLRNSVLSGSRCVCH
jgi:hypothetical protein